MIKDYCKCLVLAVIVNNLQVKNLCCAQINKYSFRSVFPPNAAQCCNVPR